MEKIPLTRAGYEKLDAELKHLKSVERPEIIAAIAEVRAHGDLSENAEYHSAKEKQSFIEGRIKELESVISLAEVIDTSKLSGPIKFGATVRLVDEDTDEERTYQIVGEYEADLAEAAGARLLGDGVEKAGADAPAARLGGDEDAVHQEARVLGVAGQER